MRSALSLLLVLAIFTVFVAGVSAGDKEVTLKGTILCAKCALKEKGITKCTTAIQVKEDGKDVVYYFDDKGNREEYHEAVCGGDRKEGAVTGTVTTKGGKKWIKPSKVEYAKKLQPERVKGAGATASASRPMFQPVFPRN